MHRQRRLHRRVRRWLRGPGRPLLRLPGTTPKPTHAAPTRLRGVPSIYPGELVNGVIQKGTLIGGRSGRKRHHAVRRGAL